MRINSRNNEDITIGGHAVEEVNDFVYLEATITKTGGGMGDMNNIIAKARGASKQLQCIWNSNNIKRQTKLKLYKTLVLAVLLYGCETWKMTKGYEGKINVFQTKCLRRIMKIRWQDHISNSELLTRTGMRQQLLNTEIKRRRWKFIGHTLRQEPDNNCNTAFT